MAKEQRSTKEAKKAPKQSKAADLPSAKHKADAAPSKKDGVAIMPCVCRSPFQESRYGAGRRVWNLGKAGGSSRSATCTVCGAKKMVAA